MMVGMMHYVHFAVMLGAAVVPMEVAAIANS